MLQPAKPNLEHIPGDRGLPLLGNLLQMLPNPLPYLQTRQARYGNLFKTGFVNNRKQVIVLGMDATEQVLLNRDDSFSNEVGYADLSRYLGPQAVLFLDGTPHRQLRQSMLHAFKPDALRHYLPMMHNATSQQIEHWRASGTKDVLSDVRALTLNAASQSIVGADLRGVAGSISEHFLNLLNATVSFAPNLPGTKKAKGAASRQWLDAYFRQQIPVHRSSNEPTLFASFCQTDMTDDVIVDNMVGIMAAAYETTASTINMMLFALAQHPQWQDRLREEFARVCGANLLEHKQLGSCEQLEWVMKETLRLYAPLAYLPRQTTKPVHLEGLDLPAHTPITLPLGYVHHLESIYPEPEKFDPLRFAPERAEDKVHGCAWVPFGKGAHACLGMHFARMEIAAFFSQVLPAFQINRDPKQQLRRLYLPVQQPYGQLPVQLQAI